MKVLNNYEKSIFYKRDMIRTKKGGEYMQYIDMHCDTLAEALARKSATAEYLKGTMVDVNRLRECGAMAQFFAMFLPQKNEPGWFGVDEMPDPEVLMEQMYQIYQNTLEACSSYLAPARNYAEFEANRRAGKISAFLTIENGYLVRSEMANVKMLYDMGVRLITLTWNDPNCFGYCHCGQPEEMQRGLTDFGKEAIEYMSELGMLIDVSHLSDGGFYDVAEHAKRVGKPFVASHSNCRALSPATRNLTDEMIKTLANCGGVAGLNFEPTFLNADETDSWSRVERMCDHVLHFIDRGGVECVGIGTDFDGISGQFEIEDCTGMPMLFEALHRRGLSEDVIERIAYQNVVRVIRESL